MKKTIDNLKSTLSQRRPGLLDSTVAYGVLCPLIWQDNQWQLLFETRAATLRCQPGEVCFPGGRLEQGETPTQGALRETQEELSLPSGQIEVLGELDFIANTAGFLLHPVLAVVHSLEGLAPLSQEVEQVFCVPLSYFRQTTPQSASYDLVAQVPESFPYDLLAVPKPYPFHPKGIESPVWVYEDHVIWGMTARIVRHLLNFSELLEKS